MTKSKTISGTTTKLTLSLLVLLISIIGIVGALGHPALATTYGPYGPTSVPTPPVTYTYTVSWNLTDARLNSQYLTTLSQVNPTAYDIYQYLLCNTVPWYFTAGKTFTIYIANATDVYWYNVFTGTTTLGQPVMMSASATANSTGGVTWNLSITLPTPINASYVYANWTIAIVLNNYAGANWLVFNVTTTNMTLQQLMEVLTTPGARLTIWFSPTVPTGYNYSLYVSLCGQSNSSYYVVLPYLYVFYLFVGSSPSPSYVPYNLTATSLQAVLTLGTGVSTTYEVNQTASSASPNIYGLAYTGFGPIYYLTNEFEGLNPADYNYPIVTAQGFNLTVQQVFASGQTVTLYSYSVPSTTLISIPTNGSSPEQLNVAEMYDFYFLGPLFITALDNGTNGYAFVSMPGLVIGVPVDQLLISAVYDLKGNPIMAVQPNLLNPIVGTKLYAKWVLQTTPTPTVVAEGPLYQYLTTPAIIPVGEYSGEAPSAPTLTSQQFPPPALYVFYESTPVFNGTITGTSYGPTYIPPITVGLLPVSLNITQYTPGVSASEAPVLSPNIVPYLTAYYAYSTSPTNLLTTTPPPYAIQGELVFAQYIEGMNYYYNESLTGEGVLAQFPPYVKSLITGYYVSPMFNYFPTPPVSATINLTSDLVSIIPPSEPQVYYYAFWVQYNGITVGYGLFELGYEEGSILNYASGVNTTPIEPVFQPYNPMSNSTLSEFYTNSSEIFLLSPLGYLGTSVPPAYAALVEVGYIAVTYTAYNVQFLNLCNETIITGTVSISEETPSGAIMTLPPLALTNVTTYKLSAPIALQISSMSGAPYIETMTPVFNFTLNYYGYIMPSVNYTTRQPQYNIQLTPGIVSVVYFPLVDININVTTFNGEYPLWGFAVSVYNYNGTFEMWHAITNSSGLVYVMNVPLNASYILPQGKAYVMLKVRTISPATDMAYSYAPVSYEYGQTYEQYASALGIPSPYYAYTLGTRGPFDEDLVIYYEPFSVPISTTCGQPFPVSVPVESLHIVVTDLEGNVLSSQPVYPCAMPSYCPSFYYNVTLVLDDQYSPYYLASQWLSFPTYYLNLTDFRVVGMTWMQPQFESLESTFQSLMAADQAAYQSGTISVQQYSIWYVGNYSYYTLAALLANYSTSSPFAIFTFPSIVPHEGTTFVRLFMPGQSFYMKVFYLGQEVFNQIVPVPPTNEDVIVTPTGQVTYTTSPVTVYIAGTPVTIPPNGTIIIETSVYPVTFNVTSKSGLYPVGNTYLGLTFTDVLYREYVMPGSALATPIAQTYISNLLYPFNVTGSGILTPSELELLTYGQAAITETYQTTTYNYNPQAVASQELINNVYSLAGYVLPNLGGFFVNSSSPTVSLTPLYMTSIYPNVFSMTPSAVAFNLTMGIPIYAHVSTTITATAYPNDTFLYAPSSVYSEYRLLVNESLMEPTEVTVNGTQTSSTQLTGLYPPTYAVEVSQSYLSTLNFTYYVVPNMASYRLWEAYINATGMTSVTNATVAIYAANSTGWYYVYSVPVTQVFQEAMVRTIPLYVYLSYAKISSVVESPSEVAVVLYVNGSGTYYVLPPAYYGNHTHIEYPVISSGFGGVVHHYTENLYTTSTGVTQTVTFTYPTVNATWYPYFGSPLTVVIPVGSNGEAVFDLPWWAPTTGAYGTTIARFWVMGTTSTTNVGYGTVTTVITPSQYAPGTVSPLPEYAISSYVLLNYITPMQGATTVYTGEIPPGVVMSNGTLYMTAIGAGTGGTSAPMLMFDTLFPEDLWNVTMSAIQAVSGVYNLRTVALESVDIYNGARFPIIVTGITYSIPSGVGTVSISPTAVAPSTVAQIPVQYIYGSTYEFASTWCDLGNYTPYIPSLSAIVYYEPPNATFYLANGTALSFTVYPNGQVQIKVGPYTYPYSISQLEVPLTPLAINFTTLYAGSELTQLSTSVAIPEFGESAVGTVYYESYNNGTSSIVGADSFVHDDLPYPTYSSLAPGHHVYWNIAGYVGPLPSASSDTEAILYFTYPTVPLSVIEDWDGRPLPNQMIVEYGVGTSPLLCAGTAPIAIDFSGSNGQLLQPLPAGNRTVVYWYDSCILYNITGGAYPYIDIYDTSISTDVSTLGNAFTATSVETHVVPATIYLKSATGTGISGALVVVFDQPTMGNEFLAFNVTGTDGSITPVDYRIYPPSTSQLPPTNYYLVAYYAANGTPLTWQQIQEAISSGATLYLVPVFENTFSIQRTVTATEAIESFTLTNVFTTASVIVLTTGFGPAPGVTLSYSISEPECPIKITSVPAPTTVGYVYTVSPLVPSPSKCPLMPAVTGSGTTNAQGQLTTATFVTPIAPFAAEVTITVQSWKGISLGYTYTYYVTSSNATTPIQVPLPAVQLTVTPVSASGQPLTTQATVNVTCAGVPIASGVGTQTMVVPIPSSGSIQCTITGYSYGKSASTTVTLTSSESGQTITRTLTIPVSGYYVPGVGFVPTSTFILLAVIIIIIIILIVILLIEYSNWRRRRLAGLLGPAK